MATDKCGCKYTDSVWVKMCPTHQAEFDATHQRWAAEHLERQQEREQQLRILCPTK